MIRYVSGDLVMSNAKVIAHGVAPNDPFNQGLAKMLGEYLPAMFDEFRHYCLSQQPKPGELWVWRGLNGILLVALFTQEDARAEDSLPGKATLSNVDHALKSLAKLCVQENWRSLALPRLATGVGGLDWEQVKPLIEANLGDLTIPVIVYEIYQANHAADEGLVVTR